MGRLTDNLAALREAEYRKLFLGQATSVVGVMFTYVALPFAVLEIGGTATDIGIVEAANLIPARGVPAHRRRVGRPPAAPEGHAGRGLPALRPAVRHRGAAHRRRRRGVAPGAAAGGHGHLRGVLPAGLRRARAAGGEPAAAAAGQRADQPRHERRRSPSAPYSPASSSRPSVPAGASASTVSPTSSAPRSCCGCGRRRSAAGGSRPHRPPRPRPRARRRGGRGRPRDARRRPGRRGVLPRPRRRLAGVHQPHLAVGDGRRRVAVPLRDRGSHPGARARSSRATSTTARAPGASPRRPWASDRSPAACSVCAGGRAARCS